MACRLSRGFAVRLVHQDGTPEDACAWPDIPASSAAPAVSTFASRFPAVLGCREIKQALRTSCPREALELLRLRSAMIDARFAEARLKLQPRPVSTLLDAQVLQLALRSPARCEATTGETPEATLSVSSITPRGKRLCK